MQGRDGNHAMESMGGAAKETQNQWGPTSPPCDGNHWQTVESLHMAMGGSITSERARQIGADVLRAKIKHLVALADRKICENASEGFSQASVVFRDVGADQYQEQLAVRYYRLMGFDIRGVNQDTSKSGRPEWYVLSW